MERQQADWVFAPEARSVAGARRLIAQKLVDVPDDVVEVVLLLASELVTNAVRHGVGPVGVHLSWDGRGVRVEVEDQSSELPVMRAVDGDALSGRGLLLVDGLSSAWGVVPGRPGKNVWFALDP